MSRLRMMRASSRRTSGRPAPAVSGGTGPAGGTSGLIISSPDRAAPSPESASSASNPPIEDTNAEDAHDTGRWAGRRRWAGWRPRPDRRRARPGEALPRRGVVYLAAVEVLALAATVGLTVLDHAVTARSMVLFAALVGLGILAAEGTRTIERMRRRLSTGQGPHLNLSSVWTLAAALVLPPVLTAATVVALYLHLWWRSWRHAGAAVYRLAFNIAAVTLSCAAAATVAGWAPTQFSLTPTRPGAALGIVAVIGAYLVTNLALAATALILLREGTSLRSALGTWGETAVEATTLCLGMLTAVLLGHPVLLVLLPLPLYVLQRSVEVRQLERAISSDPASGVLNASAWRTVADRELARAQRLERPLAVMKVELDPIADGSATAGERAVRAVADVLRRTIRSDDVTGRMERGPFVIALPDTDLAEATRVAHRIRDAVRRIHLTDQPPDSAGQLPAGRPEFGLTVSIGVTCCHGAHASIEASMDDALRNADNGLFGAGYGGRDQVCAVEPATPGPAPTPGGGHRNTPAAPSGEGPAVRSA